MATHEELDAEITQQAELTSQACERHMMAEIRAMVQQKGAEDALSLTAMELLTESIRTACYLGYLDGVKWLAKKQLGK